MTIAEPLTELDAVNMMLDAISQAPVPTLEDVSDVDVGSALLTLRSVSREVQSEGWDFNTDEGYVLLPDQNGHISLPDGTLHVDPVDTLDTLVQRGNRFYDPKKHTFVIGRSIKVDIVIALPFSDLPQAARQFITAMAIRRFVETKEEGDAQAKRQDEIFARVNLERNHALTQDVNLIPPWRHHSRYSRL